MKRTVRIAIGALVVLSLAASYGIAFFAKSALVSLVTPHNDACSNVAVLAERHLPTLMERYRFVYRVYGRGMAHCDGNDPDVRYEFAGHYRPVEDRTAFVESVMAALRSDGWQPGPSIGVTYPSATFHEGNLSLKLSLTSAGSVTGPLPATPVKPELVDAIVVSTVPLPNVDASPLPEAGGTVPKAALSQMTIFYPQPLPSGMTLDDSLSRSVYDFTLSTFTIDDGHGRRSNFDERPLPARIATPCDLYGVWYRHPLAAPFPKCARWATTASGLPVYVEQDGKMTTDPLYALADGDTTIVILRGSFKLPPLNRDEVLRLIDALQATNLERKRF